MTLHIKDGVGLAGLQHEALWAIDRVNEVFDMHSVDCWVTSARGDQHSNHSHHYKGLAVDFRNRHLNPRQSVEIVAQMEHVLGPEYQVIVESSHIHVEYDPKHKPEYQ